MRIKLYTTQSLANLLKVSVKTVHRERDEGKINYIRVVGGKVCYRESDVYRYLDGLREREITANKGQEYAYQGQKR